MAYKTINVTPETYEKLTIYKHGNMSFDDVLNKLMDMVGDEEFYKYVLQEHRRRMKMVKSGEYIDTDDLDAALREV